MRLNTRAALFVSVLADAPKVPEAEPAPTWRVPAETVRAVVKVLVPSRTSVPAPDFVSVPVTLKPVTFLSVPLWSDNVSSG